MSELTRTDGAAVTNGHTYGGRYVHGYGGFPAIRVEDIPLQTRERWVADWSELPHPRPLWEAYEAHRAELYSEIARKIDHRRPPTGDSPAPPAPRMAIPNEAMELPLGAFRFVCVAKAIAQLHGRGGYMALRHVRGVDARDIAMDVCVHQRTVKRWAIEAARKDLVRFPPGVLDGRGAWTGFDLGARLKYPTHSFFKMPLDPVLHGGLENQEVALLAYLGYREAWDEPVPIPQSELCRAIGLTPRTLRKSRQRPGGENNLRPWIISLEKRGLIEVTEGHRNSYRLRELLPN